MELRIYTTYRLLTSFFFNFFGGDEALSEDIIEVYEQLQYYFITNFYSFAYLLDIQIFLRFSLKMEYLYTDGLTPIELMMLAQRAEQLEADKKAELDKK